MTCCVRTDSLKKVATFIRQELAGYSEERLDDFVDDLNYLLLVAARERLEKLLAQAEALAAEQEQHEKDWAGK